VLALVKTGTMDRLQCPVLSDISDPLGYFSRKDPVQTAGSVEGNRGTNGKPAFLISISSDSVSWTRHL